MNHINPEKWSPEWFQLATTDDLISSLHEARRALESLDVRHRALWKTRTTKLEEELQSRDIERQDWQQKTGAI